jgi:hypothetical protein
MADTKFILMLRAIEDKRLQYIASKKLNVLYPETTFVQWKDKVTKGETIILMRAENIIEFDSLKREFDDIGVPLEIVEQKTIGGARVF